jgi:hypothetical protein
LLSTLQRANKPARVCCATSPEIFAVG